MERVLVDLVIVDVFDDIDLQEELKSKCWFESDEEKRVVTSPLSGHFGLKIKVLD